MATAQAQHVPPEGASLTSRLFEAAPLPPAAVGASISIAVLALFFGIEWASGQIAEVLAGTAKEHIPLHFRVNAVNALLLGLLPTALYSLDRWRDQTADELRPLLRSPRPTPAPDRRVGTAIGAAMAAAGLYAFMIRPYGRGLFLSSDYWVFEHIWDWFAVPILFFWTGRLAYTLVFDAIAISRRARELTSIELLDLRPLFPFVRHGLRAALIVILFIAIGSLHAGNAIIDADSLRTLPLAFLVLGSAAMLVPVWGVHRRIADEKQAELGRLRARIARARDALEREGEGEDAEVAARRLPALLALEARIAAVREWPFDAPSLMRFGLYVLLGLGSWLGAAAVERLLDSALG